jgi:hypothetical protein
MAGEARILTLFLSNGKSLLAWEREAVLSREILLYLNFLREDVFDRIQIFSYDAGDRQFLKELAKTDPLYERMDILAPKSGALFGTRAARWGVQGVFEHRKAIARSRRAEDKSDQRLMGRRSRRRGLPESRWSCAWAICCRAGSPRMASGVGKGSPKRSRRSPSGSPATSWSHRRRLRTRWRPIP